MSDDNIYICLFCSQGQYKSLELVLWRREAAELHTKQNISGLSLEFHVCIHEEKAFSYGLIILVSYMLGEI